LSKINCIWLKCYTYVIPSVAESEFPYIPKEQGAKISCNVCPDNEVQIVGNSAGLTYLARYFAAMALLDKRNGLHVHLDPETGELEAGSSVLTICNLDFGP
jgi:hypothetical protein